MSDRLTDGFPARSYEDWLAAATKSLEGQDFEAELVAHTLDGIRIAPIHARLAAGDTGTGYLGRSQAGGWTIDQRHADPDSKSVNAAVLEDLAAGAGAVTLQLAVPGQFGLPARLDAIAAALAGVQLDVVSIGLRAGDQYIGAAQCLAALWEEQRVAGVRCRAALSADPLGHLARTGALETELWSSLEVLAHFVRQNVDVWPATTLLLADGLPYHEAGASEAEELAGMIATLVEYLRALDYEDLRPDRALRTVVAGLAADVDLFLTLAKFRAARLLIARVADACGAGHAARAVRLHATTSERMLTRQDPQSNTLRTTVAAAGAILGGTDSLAVLPHCWAIGRPDAAARRLARNTQIVLMEESALGRVEDPAGGSGYVDRLTSDLATAAWDIFQSIEADGGMAKTLLSGSFAERVARTAARRSAEVSDGRRAITGVTSFAPKSEVVPALPPHPPAPPVERAGTRVRAFAPSRLPAHFETIAT